MSLLQFPVLSWWQVANEWQQGGFKFNKQIALSGSIIAQIFQLTPISVVLICGSGTRTIKMEYGGARQHGEDISMTLLVHQLMLNVSRMCNLQFSFDFKSFTSHKCR